MTEVEKNQFTLLLENNICKGLKILKLGYELKFISPRHKIPTMTHRYFNYVNEDGLRKNILVLKKILLLPSLFYILLNKAYVNNFKHESFKN